VNKKPRVKLSTKILPALSSFDKAGHRVRLPKVLNENTIRSHHHRSSSIVFVGSNMENSYMLGSGTNILGLDPERRNYRRMGNMHKLRTQALYLIEFLR